MIISNLKSALNITNQEKSFRVMDLGQYLLSLKWKQAYWETLL